MTNAVFCIDQVDVRRHTDAVLQRKLCWSSAILEVSKEENVLFDCFGSELLRSRTRVLGSWADNSKNK